VPAARAPRAETVGSLILSSARRLERAGVTFGHGTSNPIDEAAWLVRHALALPVAPPRDDTTRRVSADGVQAARALIAERIQSRKPAAYLLSEAWLGPYRFHVDERVIVPRSFIAELLLSDALAPWVANPASVRSALDLCTGSGCLAILLAKVFPLAAVDGSDISPDALAVARKNVSAYRLGKRVRPVESDLLAALQGRTYDLIVSNPPYVTAASMRRLPPEYRAEPGLALASGPDGLEHTRTILREARRHLNPGGILVVEIGHNRRALERAFPSLPFAWPALSSGEDAVFVLERDALPR